MALPVLAKTWEVTSKAILPADISGGTVKKMNQYMLWFIKQGFLSGTVPWTVLGSSDSVAAGLDAVDRWVDYTNVVLVLAAGTAHSWIVLKQTGMGSGNFQICIDCIGNLTSGHIITIATSYNAGFTGGNTTARPTATDECAQSFTFGNTNIYYNTAVHVFKSTDGASSRVVSSWNGGISYMWIIETPKNPKSWWTTPYVFGIFAPAIGIWSGTFCYARIDGATCILRATTHCSSIYPVISENWSLVPDLNGEWFTYPIGLVSMEVTRKGRMGEVHDMYFSPSNWPVLYLPASPKAYLAQSGLLVGWELGKPFIVMSGTA